LPTSRAVIKLAVLGFPIDHSLSPRLHQVFAKQFGLSIAYHALAVHPSECEQKIHELRQENYLGCNITAPLKTLAYDFCEPSPAAQLAKSVNCLSFESNGRIYGDNFDGISFIEELHAHEILIQNKHIAILGAGGAVQGILPPLLTQQPAKIMLINRNTEKSHQLVNAFKSNCLEALSQTQYAELRTPMDIVIHATPVQTNPFPLRIPVFNLNNPRCVAIDLQYGRAADSFLHAAKQQHAAICLDGFGLLVRQAAKSFERWLGLAPDIRHLTAHDL